MHHAAPLPADVLHAESYMQALSQLNILQITDSPKHGHRQQLKAAVDKSVNPELSRVTAGLHCILQCKSSTRQRSSQIPVGSAHLLLVLLLLCVGLELDTLCLMLSTSTSASLLTSCTRLCSESSCEAFSMQHGLGPVP